MPKRSSNEFYESINKVLKLVEELKGDIATMKEENATMKEENAIMKEENASLKEDMKALKEIVGISRGGIPDQLTVSNTIPPPKKMSSLSQSDWREYIMNTFESSTEKEKEHLIEVGNTTCKSVCDRYENDPRFSCKPWRDITPANRLAMKQLAYEGMVQACPELASIEVCQDLWPIHASLQPKWSRSISYQKRKMDAAAERKELEDKIADLERAQAASSSADGGNVA